MVLWILGLAVAVVLLIALVVTVIWMVRTAKRHDREDAARMQSDVAESGKPD